MSRDQVAVVDVLSLQALVDGEAEFFQVLRLFSELDEPLVVGQSAFGRTHLRSHRELDHLGVYEAGSRGQRLFHLFGDHVFAEGADEMLHAARHHQAVGIGAHEAHRIAEAVAPEAGVRVEHDGVVHAGLHLPDRQAGGVGREVLGQRDELVEDAAVQHEQHARVAGDVLVGDEALAGGIQLDRVDGPADALLDLGAVGFVVHAPVHEQFEVREDVLDRFARAGREAVEVHLHPGRDAGDEAHVGAQRLLDDRVDFHFPVLDRVGGVGGELVAAEVGRHVVVHDARESAGEDAVRGIEGRAARDEDQLAVEEAGLARAVDVVEQRVAGALDVVGDGSPGDGDVLRPGGGAGGLGQVQRLPGPEHVVFGCLHPVEPGPQRLVVAHRHLLGKMRVGPDRIEGMVLPESRHASVPDELIKDPLLRPPRMPAPIPRLRRHQGSERTAEGGEEGHLDSFGCVGIAKLGNLGEGSRGWDGWLG